MKLLRVLELLSETLPLVFILQSCLNNKVAVLAKEDNLDCYVGGNGVENSTTATHSRAKRFIAFPVGSSFSTAVCITTGVIGNPRFDYLSMGLNWGIAYDLPNSTWVLQHANGFGPQQQEEQVSSQIKRRHRRDLYNKMETLINRAFRVAANKNSSTTLSPFVVDNNVLAINNLNGNFFNKNQITFDILQTRLHNTDDNDLLSPATKNITNTSSCGNRVCNKNTTTCHTQTNSIQRNETQLATFMASNTAGLMTNITEMSISNVSPSLSISQTKSSPSSSSLLFSSTLISSSPSSLLLQQPHLLSRTKRYLSFPEGASFSVAVCFTVGIIGNPRYNYMSFGLNWGVAYDLPNTTWILNHLHGFAKQPIPVAYWHRRSRRSLYKEIENVVDNMGYNGRDCVLRALCESRHYFQKTKISMIGEMMRVVFSLPKQRIFTRELEENSDIVLYDRAYRKVRSIVDCAEEYDCSFSLLELAFGKYSTPPDGYYTEH